ncbi:MULTISPECIES: hypothetical protein [Pseudomonas]|jgi:hypothetical protein|uniref:Uncharacterized protein n=1 Tax=Pseudomonas mosselii TaxID=78327 RepID=A0A5R8ZFW0_9PSED|nr:hypothetical protein [Pseudomonas mosselii]TLP64640.1 hypothetical protein FEM01_00225 [Pseudomonas mosselii]
MTQVYSASLDTVVANGDPYVKTGQFLYDVPNCLPLNGPQVGERYMLIQNGKPQISVICTAQGMPGIQTASFREV